MGISPSLARAIIQEHKYKPIDGDIVLIGVQTMGMTVQEAKDLCREQGIEPLAGLPDDQMLDRTTRSAQGKKWISDKGFFSLFTTSRVTTIDVTDYEGADIVHDMHTPIPKELENIADFLWIGSCLDNMCDPITALQNSIRMLRPSGRLIDMEMAIQKYNAYLVYSPSYFFDFFAINKFADCKIHLVAFPEERAHGEKWSYYSLESFEASKRMVQYERIPRNYSVITYIVAEKGKDSSWDKKPVQGQYRPDDAPYKEAFEIWKSSTRPELKTNRTFRFHKRINRMLPSKYKSLPNLSGYKFIGEM